MLHSPTTPMCRTTLIAASRSIKYSRFVSVCDGATTMESPVCTPRGSKFSMLQTVMQLSRQSRTTSYSTSFHPRKSWSTRICGDFNSSRATFASTMSSSALSAKPDPAPPKVNAARTSTGYPIVSAACRACATVVAAMDKARVSSISFNLVENISRSSVEMMASICVPRTRIPRFCSSPRRQSSMPTFRAVWPPMLRMMPSISVSLSRMRTTVSAVTGKR
mmetsp:Transcript_21859/g.74115  ORF Transcript_21859/g.74115 Transcript_21859/m.74115 type:complete len:220 (+) Transcript_21859:2689-3348(+)